VEEPSPDRNPGRGMKDESCCWLPLPAHCWDSRQEEINRIT